LSSINILCRLTLIVRHKRQFNFHYTTQLQPVTPKYHFLAGVSRCRWGRNKRANSREKRAKEEAKRPILKLLTAHFSLLTGLLPPVRPCSGQAKKGLKSAFFDILDIWNCQKMAIFGGARSPLAQKKTACPVKSDK
jgi:hypothetical protein